MIRDTLLVEEILNLLRMKIEIAGSVAHWAYLHKIPRYEVDNVLYGRSAPTRDVLEALGYRKLVVYEPVERSKE